MSLSECPQALLALDEHAIPQSILKQPWIPPQLILLFEFDISNNPSGGGDGDAAFAHS